MRPNILLLACLLAATSWDKSEKTPPVPTVICNDRRTPRPGVSFDTLVLGDPEGHPLLVLISRDEQSLKVSKGPPWEVRETSLPGFHDLVIDGHLSGYGGIPVVKAWSSQETDRQYCEVRLPVEWIRRFTIALDSNGPRHLPGFKDPEIEAFWIEKVRPLFPIAPRK